MHKDNPFLINGFLELTQSLAGEHLSIAVRQLLESRELRRCPPDPWSWLEAHRCSLSSILHAYSGLEAAINLIGYRFFFDQQSPTYVPPEQRDLPLQRMLKGWSTVIQVAEKLSYILSLVKYSLPPRLENELRELNNYRNWIAHGLPFRTTLLVDPQVDGSFLVFDREDDVNWEAKFPNTKFNSLDRIDDEDSTTALRIALECLKIAAVHNLGQTLFVLSLRWKKRSHVKIIDAEFDLADYLREREDH